MLCRMCFTESTQYLVEKIFCVLIQDVGQSGKRAEKVDKKVAKSDVGEGLQPTNAIPLTQKKRDFASDVLFE